jgi:hypothetical protein
MTVFQLVCLALLPLGYGLLQRVDRDFLRTAPWIFVAAWLGEASAIWFYGFYRYSDAWWWKVGGVPLLIPLIWPPIILSGRAVIRALWPNLGSREPWAVGAIVFFDAAMIEAIAVRCGLWSWAEPGYLGVPLIGVVGWGVFAAAVAHLERPGTCARRRWEILAAPVPLHLGLLLSWWLFLRWVWRGDWFILFLLIVVAFTVVAWRVRGARRMGMDIASVRLLAAGIFVLLLVFAHPGAGRVWLHIALTSIPYALATDFHKKMLAGSPA